jgi:hypothetical protein
MTTPIKATILHGQPFVPPCEDRWPNPLPRPIEVEATSASAALDAGWAHLAKHLVAGTVSGRDFRSLHNRFQPSAQLMDAWKTRARATLPEGGDEGDEDMPDRAVDFGGLPGDVPLREGQAG